MLLTRAFKCERRILLEFYYTCLWIFLSGSILTLASYNYYFSKNSFDPFSNLIDPIVYHSQKASRFHSLARLVSCSPHFSRRPPPDCSTENFSITKSSNFRENRVLWNWQTAPVLEFSSIYSLSLSLSLQKASTMPLCFHPVLVSHSLAPCHMIPRLLQRSSFWLKKKKEIQLPAIGS